MPSPETQQTTSKPLSATLESHLATSKLHGQKLADAVENHLRSSWGSKSKSKRKEETEEEEEGAETASMPHTPTQITVQGAGLDQVNGTYGLVEVEDADPAAYSPNQRAYRHRSNPGLELFVAAFPRGPRLSVWYIADVKQQEVYYVAPVFAPTQSSFLEGAMVLPPAEGWRLAFPAGRAPAPRVSIFPQEEEQEEGQEEEQEEVATRGQDQEEPCARPPALLNDSVLEERNDYHLATTPCVDRSKRHSPTLQLRPSPSKRPPKEAAVAMGPSPPSSKGLGVYQEPVRVQASREELHSTLSTFPSLSLSLEQGIGEGDGLEEDGLGGLYDQQWRRLLEEEQQLRQTLLKKKKEEGQRARLQVPIEAEAMVEVSTQEGLEELLRHLQREAVLRELELEEEEEREREEVEEEGSREDKGKEVGRTLTQTEAAVVESISTTDRAGTAAIGDARGGEQRRDRVDWLSAGGRVRQTRVEVLGTEKSEGQTAVVFLVRLTSVEEEEEEGEEEEGEEQDEDGGEVKSRRRVGLVQHRLRVIRSSQADWDALHEKLQDLAAAPAQGSSLSLAKRPPFSPVAMQKVQKQGRRNNKPRFAIAPASFLSSSHQAQAQCDLLQDYLQHLLDAQEGPGREEQIVKLLQSAFQAQDGREDLLISFHVTLSNLQRSPEMTAARREELWMRQDGRCLGCGRSLLKGFLEKKNFMTDRYLQGLLCTDFCEKDTGNAEARSILPGEVLACWDFCKRRVARVSLALLDTMRHHPVFPLPPFAAAGVGVSVPGVGKEVRREIKYLQNLRQQLRELTKNLPLLTESGKPRCPTVSLILEEPILMGNKKHWLALGGVVDDRVSLEDLMEIGETNGLSECLSGVLEELTTHMRDKKCHDGCHMDGFHHDPFSLR